MYKLNGEDKGSTIAINRIVCQILGLDNESVIYPDCTTADLPVLTADDANKAVCFDTTDSEMKVWSGVERTGIALS